MPEPHSTVGAGIIIGSGIGLTGTIMGAQLDAVVLGLVVSILVSIWMPTINDRIKAAAAVGATSLAAGYGSPVAALLVARFFDVPDPEQIRMLMALLISTAFPILIPSIMPVIVARIADKATGNEKGPPNG